MAVRDTFITPVVSLIYPKIQRPDTQGKFPTGKYQTKWAFENAADEEAFKKTCKAKAKELMPKVSKPKFPWKLEEGEEDPRTIFWASSKYKPALFDSQNGPVGDDAKIGGGTRARLLVAFNSFENRLSLYLNQVQIVELVEWESKAQSSAFEKTEGFKAEKEEAAAEEAGEDNNDEDVF